MSVKFLILSTELSGGGAEYVTRLMIENIPSCIGVVFENKENFRTQKSLVLEIPYISTKNWVIKILFNVFRLMYIQAVKLKYQPQVTISHLEGPNISNILTLFGGKRILFVHNSLNRNYRSTGIPGKAKKLLATWLYPKSDTVVGVSKDICDELVSDYGVARDCITYLNNPVDNATIRERSIALYGDWRDELFNKNYLVNVASLTTQKNHKLLLKIFGVLVGRYHDLKLVIIGKGDTETEIRTMCNAMGLRISSLNGKDIDSTHIFLLGYQNNPYPLVRNGKIFVMTSEWEGLPISLLEAMSLKTPIVISDCSTAIRQIMLSIRSADSSQTVDGAYRTDYGYLIGRRQSYGNVDHVNTWVAAICQLLTDKLYYKSCKQAVSEQAREYDISNISKRWYELLEISNAGQK